MLRRLFPMVIAAALAVLTGCDHEGGDAELDAGVVSSHGNALARIDRLRGGVTVERDGQKSQAQLGSLFEHDVVTTAADGAVHIVLDGGRTVELGPNGRFVVGEKEGAVTLEVSRGQITSRAEKAPAGKPGAKLSFAVLTPFGLTKLSDGEASIDVGEQTARVQVAFGQAEIVGQDGVVKTVGAGEKLEIAIGAAKVVKPEPAMEFKVLPAQLVKLNGKAQLKKKDSARWIAVNRSGVAVSAGDSLRVQKGSTTLRFEGSTSEMTLYGGTELQLQQTGKGADGERSKIDLKKGGLSLDLTSAAASHVELAGMELASDHGGQVTITKTRDGYEVDARTGDIKLTRNGTAQTVVAGQVARVGPKLQVDDEERAAVAVPTKLGLTVLHPGLKQVALSWPGGEKDYQLEVATDASFETKILSGVVHHAYVNVAAPPKGNLHWRISDASGKSLDRGSAHFAPEPKRKELSHLRNEVTDGVEDEKTTIYYEDKPPAVTFLYKPEEKAQKYRLAVFKAEALDKPVAEKLANTDNVALEGGALGEGKYLWSVTPLSAAGEELRGGKLNKLELVYDNSTSSLQITQPANGDPAAAEVPIAGVASPGSQLFVNGQSVPMDEKFRFHATAAPAGRPPVLVFRLTRPKAADVLVVRALKAKR